MQVTSPSRGLCIDTMHVHDVHRIQYTSVMRARPAPAHRQTHTHTHRDGSALHQFYASHTSKFIVIACVVVVLLPVMHTLIVAPLFHLVVGRLQ